MEIENKKRCTIITVPTLPILHSKHEDYPELDIVHGDISFQQIEDYFTSYKPGQKIMTTPEGFRRLMAAAFLSGRYEEVITEWFLLLDECHTFASEDFREDILCPFEYFWDFSYKSLISATPYYFSDPRFRSLTHYKVTFDAPLGKITLVDSRSPMATLDWVLTHPNDYPGNLHIQLNAVIEIKHAATRAGLTDFNIFCAPGERNRNIRNLGDLAKHYKEQPKKDEYKKFNFYTQKYFEGWDLYDDDATMILVTNVHVPHTKIGVKSKGKQAIGRLRDKAHRYIHITNHNHISNFKSLEIIRKEFQADAEFLINQNNDYARECRKHKRTFREDKRLKYFADRNKFTNIAILNPMKLDQQIDEAANNEIYNHIDYIEQDWKDGYFDVEIEPSNLQLDSATKLKRKSKAEQLKEDYLALREYHKAKQGGMVISLLGSIEKSIQASNPTAYLAEKFLDETTMERLNYNVKLVKEAIILQENVSSEVKVLKLLSETFKVGKFYTNEDIKVKLQNIYNKVNIREKNGEVKKALAVQIGEQGRFDVDATKRDIGKGEKEHGLLILRAQFGLRMAA